MPNQSLKWEQQRWDARPRSQVRCTFSVFGAWRPTAAVPLSSNVRRHRTIFSAMRKKFPLVRYAVIALLGAISLTVLSIRFERKGPELAPYGNLCGPQSNELCLEPVLNAGLPFAYLFDQPGTSVERRLFLFEDQFRVIPFTLNVAVYFLVFCLLAFFSRRIGRNT
jgi:hypothetical protein